MRFDIYKILSFALILVVQGVSYAQTCPDVFGDLNGSSYIYSSGGSNPNYSCLQDGGDINIKAINNQVQIKIEDNTVVVWDVSSVNLTSVTESNGGLTIDKYGIDLIIGANARLYIYGDFTMNHLSSIQIEETGLLTVQGNFYTNSMISPTIIIKGDQATGGVPLENINGETHNTNLHVTDSAFFNFTNVFTDDAKTQTGNHNKIYVEDYVYVEEFDDSKSKNELIDAYLRTVVDGYDDFPENYFGCFCLENKSTYRNFVDFIDTILGGNNFEPIDGENNSDFFGGIDKSQKPPISVPDLPVELTYFNAFIQTITVVLEWETASEQNASHFDVQRSSDQQNWTTIGTVNAQGNSNVAVEYEFIDEAPLSKAYYRLHQVDFDGLNEFFGPLYVTTTSVSEEFEVTLMPNNIVNGEKVNFRLSGGIPASMMSASMYDGTGRMLQSEEIELKQSATYTSLHLTSEMKPGVYYVVFRNGKSIARKRLIVR
ncbi:hypothetical protein [Flammeovirga agarivorans]|uniref:Por secretion system C-terminal sorting domain-containing protein n=1 Tax=Flammeovirga agarivorans TaxID=2726742 RepID=A0A7X8SMZ9_9BACT|nr:hypothetical protein [Flammeovirga agarivorans]NLR93162.1 hypothetical protein [Flammeovirga agarivorans]